MHSEERVHYVGLCCLHGVVVLSVNEDAITLTNMQYFCNSWLKNLRYNGTSHGLYLCACPNFFNGSCTSNLKTWLLGNLTLKYLFQRVGTKLRWTVYMMDVFSVLWLWHAQCVNIIVVVARHLKSSTIRHNLLSMFSSL